MVIETLPVVLLSSLRGLFGIRMQKEISNSEKTPQQALEE